MSPVDETRAALREGVAIELLWGNHDRTAYIQRRLDRIDESVRQVCDALGEEEGMARLNVLMARRQRRKRSNGEG